LLKEAIADAKAVRETAIANAKIALEEAFTPRLQSILSKKLQAEMEGDDEDVDEELDSSDIGKGDEETPVEPSDVASDAHTELGPESEEETAEVGDELEDATVSESEEEGDDESISEEEDDKVEEEYKEGDDENHSEVKESEEGDDESISEEEDDKVEESEEDELDLEAIIKELEMGMDDESDEGVEETHYKEDDNDISEEEGEESEEEESEEESEEEAEEIEAEEEDEMDDEIDLDEILREMGYGAEVNEEEESEEDDEANEEVVKLQTELEEAYSTVKSLQSTINEVNLLNAKLLYANRLFRGYNLTNEQKSKVVENLDRTTSVREVKLVYATLAESMNFTGTEKRTKKVVSEGASKPVASTAPVKNIISENTNTLAERFKQLANIK
jgi:hypothetical protein